MLDFSNQFYLIICHCLYYIKIKGLINYWRYKNTLLSVVSTVLYRRLVKVKKNKIADFSIHMLLSDKDYHKFIICYYSLLRFLDELPEMLIYDDGTLSKQKKIILEKIPGVFVISTSMQKRGIKKYTSNQVILKFWKKNPFDKKLINLAMYSTHANKALILDSDIIFYKYPQLLLKYLQRNISLSFAYMSDYQDAYILNTEEIKKKFNISIKHRVNSGCLVFTPTLVSKEFIQKYYALLDKDRKNHIVQQWTEQTALAILVSMHESKKLPREYYMGVGRTPAKTICRHYTSLSEDEYLKDLYKLFK